jgi:hypothetical protein
MMAFELILLSELRDFWLDIVSKVGTAEDVVPDIFEGLPADGDGAANWKAIGENFRRMATGHPGDDVSFVLQYPAVKAQIPGISIETGTDIEDDVVGSFIEENFNEERNQVERRIGGPYIKTFMVGVHSFNPDTTLYLYSMLKYGLLILRNSFDDVASITITGRPMQVDFQTYAPDAVYIRYIDIRVEGILDSAIERYDKVIKTDVEAV